MHLNTRIITHHLVINSHWGTLLRDLHHKNLGFSPEVKLWFHLIVYFLLRETVLPPIVTRL